VAVVWRRLSAGLWAPVARFRPRLRRPRLAARSGNELRPNDTGHVPVAYRLDHPFCRPCTPSWACPFLALCTLTARNPAGRAQCPSSSRPVRPRPVVSSRPVVASRPAVSFPPWTKRMNRQADSAGRKHSRESTRKARAKAATDAFCKIQRSLGRIVVRRSRRLISRLLELRHTEH